MKTKKDEKITLNVDKREVVGKKVKQLRKQGLIPANIFGPDIKSQSITVPLKELSHAYKLARETGIVYLAIGTESIPTLFKHIQRHPISDSILHVDFRKIDLTQKIETAVPVEVTGASEAVSVKGGVLLTQANELIVEALPQDIPQKIEIDITGITEIGQEIKVKDLKKSGAYEIKDEAEKVIVSVIAHKEESLEAETTTAGPEIITEKKEEGEEGAETTPATGTEKSDEKQGKEEKPKEEKKEEKK